MDIEKFSPLAPPTASPWRSTPTRGGSIWTGVGIGERLSLAA